VRLYFTLDIEGQWELSLGLRHTHSCSHQCGRLVDHAVRAPGTNVGGWQYLKETVSKKMEGTYESCSKDEERNN
jgi:hypothetical protein